MYQVCPGCKKLVPEDSSSCPNCGRGFPGKGSYRSKLWWCNNCKMYVDPKYASKGSSVGTGNALMAISSLVSGNINDAIQHGEIGAIKQQISSNPDNYRCPKCGGTNLRRKPRKNPQKQNSPALDALKMRFVKGEITQQQYLEMTKLIE